ncbi:HAMP domain-containing histidine kinase [bacterium]|nr:HAMP domain-containing histidine kinase [bacterium]
MVTSAASVSERRYGSLFGAAPVGMIEADFSAIGAWLTELPVAGPSALRDYLLSNPDQITEAFSLLEIEEVNRAALDLMRVDSRRTLVQRFAKTSNSQQALKVFAEQLIAISEQRAVFEMRYTAERADGEEFSAVLGTTFPQNAYGDLVLSHGVVSVTDISHLDDSLGSDNDLLASVSHELKTPLTSLAGFSRLLAENPDGFDNAEKAQTVAIIAQQAEGLTYIVENLLVASREDLSTLPLRMEPVGMATFLSMMSLDLNIIRAGKQLRFGPCEAVLYADQLQLRHILWNLIDNAMTYGGDEITIDALTRGDSGIATVSDNGAGLPQGQESLVFERQERVARSKDQPMSLGLGLPVARSLAQAMGGALTYSREGGLTIFELKLDLPPAASALSDVASDVDRVEHADAVDIRRIPA